MEFEYSKKTKMYMEQLTDFMGKHIYPNEPVFRRAARLPGRPLADAARSWRSSRPRRASAGSGTSSCPRASAAPA